MGVLNEDGAPKDHIIYFFFYLKNLKLGGMIVSMPSVSYEQTRLRDFNWFVENYNDIFAKYGRCYVAIKNQRILGVYSSALEGIRETQKQEPPGSFSIQFCNGDESGYTAYIASTNFS